MKKWMVVILAASLLPATTFAQRGGGGGNDTELESPLSPEQKEKFANAKPEDITNENFPETIESFDYPNAEISDVIKAISELTGKNFIIDPGVRGKITIIAPSKITVAEAYRAFLSALAINGYTIIPSGKFLKIRSSRNAQRDSIETYSGDYFPNSDQMITRIVHLKHISAEAVNKELRVLTSKDGEMSTYEQTNSIVISDYGSNIERVMRIIVQLDVPGFEEKLQVMRVKHAKAKDIADLIDQILNKDKDGGSTNRRSRFRSRRSRNKDAKAEGGGSNVSFNVIPDERTNSLIVVGNSAGIRRIRNLLKRLDFKLAPDEAGGVFVYYVRYGDAEEIAKTLSGVAEQASGDSGGARSGGRNNDGPPVLTQQVFGGDVKITADKTTNSLIITASKPDYDVVLNLLERIDIPRDQVFVEAIIMEMAVNDNNSKGIGVIKFPDGGNGNFPMGFNGIDNFGQLIGPIPAPGTTLGLINGNEIDVTIPGGSSVKIKDTLGFVNFLTTHSKTNILSTPQITVLDNEEGEIEVGEKINIGRTQTTTTTGGTQSSSNFEDASIKLKIKPFISPSSNSIRMEVDQKVQQANKGIQDAPGEVVTTNRSVTTNIVVSDGDTVVLGGLMRDEVTESESKVPLLGDIPILGWLFRSTRENISKVNLMIFLTPHIVRNQSDSKKLLSRKVDQRIEFIKDTGGVDPFGKEFDRITGAFAPGAPEARSLEGGILPEEPLPAEDDVLLDLEATQPEEGE